MESYYDQDYVTLSENEDSSDEVVEITPILPAKNKRGRPAKSSKALGKQKVASTSGERSNQNSLTTLESTDQASNDSILQPIGLIKTQVKVSWVWDYFIRKQNEKGEIRAYCQFILDNGEKCSKNYKYDGSTGNLGYHIVKHGITPPADSFMSENKLKQAQPISNNYGQREKELLTLRWILLTTQPLST